MTVWYGGIGLGCVCVCVCVCVNINPFQQRLRQQQSKMRTGTPVQTPSDPTSPLVSPAIPPTDRTAGTKGKS